MNYIDEKEKDIKKQLTRPFILPNGARSKKK